MSTVSDSESSCVDSGQELQDGVRIQRKSNSEHQGTLGRSYGGRNSRGPWAGLDKETQERYAAIEKRVREKMRKGLL